MNILKRISALLLASLLLAFSAQAAVTPNKNYTLQTTGSNVNTWGTILNNNFSIIDANIGGTLAVNIAGASGGTYSLTSAQSQNLIHNLSGTLTGNVNYQFPDAGGSFYINNETSGNYTVTVSVVGGSGSIIVPQGTVVSIYVDASIPAVQAASGTQYVFNATTVGGTANAITVSQTAPTNFSLVTGALLTLTPIYNNTGAATLNVNGSGAINIQKVGATGLVQLQGGDLFTAIPNILQYNGSIWIDLDIIFSGTPTNYSTSFGLTFSQWLQPVNCTAPLTITVPQVSTNFAYYFNFRINAAGGAVTITPYSTDVINVNGVALSAGTSYVIPQGASAYFYTDANGNIFLQVSGANLSSSYSFAQYGATATSNSSSTQLANMAAVVASQTGGYVNKFRNGNFSVAQRGTSGVIAAGTSAYTVDGWVVSATGGNVAWFWEGNQGNYANTGLYLQGASGVTDVSLYQRIEGHLFADAFAQLPIGTSGTMTSQIMIANGTGAAFTPTISVAYANAIDNWGSSTTDVSAASLRTMPIGVTYQEAYTWTPSSANYTNGVQVKYDFGNALNGTGKYVELYAADLRNTPNVSTGINLYPPVPEQRSYPAELAFCQRYFVGYSPASSGSPIVIGSAVNATSILWGLYLPVPMRIAPTGISVNNLGYATNNGSTYSAVTPIFSDASPTLIIMSANPGGLTTSFWYPLGGAASGAYLYVTGAEL